MNDVPSLRFTYKMLKSGYQQWGISVDAEPETHSFFLMTSRINSSFYFRKKHSKHPDPSAVQVVSPAWKPRRPHAFQPTIMKICQALTKLLGLCSAPGQQELYDQIEGIRLRHALFLSQRIKLKKKKKKTKKPDS